MNNEISYFVYARSPTERFYFVATSQDEMNRIAIKQGLIAGRRLELRELQDLLEPHMAAMLIGMATEELLMAIGKKEHAVAIICDQSFETSTSIVL